MAILTEPMPPSPHETQETKMSSDLVVGGLSSTHVWDYENGFYWFTDPKRMGKLIAHYEIYKKITSLAGHIVECGVYKGNSLIRLATYRHLLEVPHSREIIAFDAFGTFPAGGISRTDDHQFIERFENTGGDGLSKNDVESLLDLKKLSENMTLIQGDVRETIPKYREQNPSLRIALLHLDMDVYEPTKFALEQLWEQLVPGAIIMIDDYNAVAGATKAIDEFVASNTGLKIEKLPYCHVPAFIQKPI